MDIIVKNPKDFFPDDGRHHKLYPIPEKEEESFLVYDNKIQRMSHIQANIVAVFEEWFTSFFEKDYFKFIRLKTESSFSEFKSFMRDIYKKEKPFLVIDIESNEHVEDSLFGWNMIGRYNMIDPRYDTHSAKLLYSIGLLNTDSVEIRYRRNRYRFTFDVLIMEKTLDRQQNTFINMLMNIRHRSMFTLVRSVMNLIPLEYIHNVALVHGFSDYKSEEFLEFLNNHSCLPIIRRILPNGQWMFYMQQEIHLHVEIPNIPSKDSPETSNAFEHGARIRDNFIFEVDLPSEFLFITTKDFGATYVKGKDYDPEKFYFVAQEKAFPDLPKEWNNAILANTMKIAIDEPSDNKLDILTEVIQVVDSNLYDIIFAHIAQGHDINDLVCLKVYGQKYNQLPTEVSFTLSRTGTLEIGNPDVRRLYMIGTYIHMGKINAIQKGNYTEYIGTIEKY